MNKLSFSYYQTKIENDQESLPLFSEFCDGAFGNRNYDLPQIIMLYQYKLSNELDALNDEHFKKWFQKNLELFPSRSKQSTWSKLQELVTLDSSEDGAKIEVKKQVQKFREAAEDLRMNALDKVNDPDKFFCDEEIVKRYLSAFYDISKDVVFSENNINLFNVSFRKSEFLSSLISFAAIKKSLGSPTKAYYEYSFFNPFAYDTIEKTLHGMHLLSQDIKNNDLLSELRKSVFFDSAQSAFKRYVFLDGKTYRLNLNRHDSTLKAFPVDLLSSIEEIKPIRLFEKTASYIRDELEKLPDSLPELEVKVCIIGHTEISQCGNECSLMDYIAAVLNWFSRLSVPASKAHSFKFNLTNIISNFDWPGTSKRRSFTCTSGDHSAKCEIKQVDYENTFGLNMQTLKDQIENNDLIFLLDCPWLSSEDFEIKQSGTLDMFCRELSYYDCNEKPDDDAKRERFINNSHSFYKDSVFRVLDSQYNRIMASTTTKSGEIVRVMRDYLFRRINKIFEEERQSRGIQDYRKRKILYIFSSESEGIKHSYLATYPLIRKEKYDGRAHTIIKFDNEIPHSLKYENLHTEKLHAIQFDINLWSIIKYVSVSYAYLYFREIIKGEIEKCINCKEFQPENSISYFELYRNIVAHFSVSQNMSTIVIEIGFKQGIDDCIEDFLTQNSDDKQKKIGEIKEKLKERVYQLLKPLYTRCVFDYNQHYGDDAIKTAFAMNLYSCISNVNMMLFWHKYRMICKTRQFDAFKVTVTKAVKDECFSSIVGGDEFLHRDYFMDKRLYDSVMQVLEQTTDMTVGLRGMFYSADDLYKKTGTLQKTLNNIVKACDSAGYTDTNLYKNIKQVLMED